MEAEKNGYISLDEIVKNMSPAEIQDYIDQSRVEGEANDRAKKYFQALKEELKEASGNEARDEFVYWNNHVASHKFPSWRKPEQFMIEALKKQKKLKFKYSNLGIVEGKVHNIVKILVPFNWLPKLGSSKTEKAGSQS